MERGNLRTDIIQRVEASGCETPDDWVFAVFAKLLGEHEALWDASQSAAALGVGAVIVIENQRVCRICAAMEEKTEAFDILLVLRKGEGRKGVGTHSFHSPCPLDCCESYPDDMGNLDLLFHRVEGGH